MTDGDPGQGRQRGSGEEINVCFEPSWGCLCPQTYSVDRQVPDSASTATAYLCGVKTNYKTIGVSAAARFDQCNTTFGNEVFSVMYRAKKAGRLVLVWVLWQGRVTG